MHNIFTAIVLTSSFMTGSTLKLGESILFLNTPTEHIPPFGLVPKAAELKELLKPHVVDFYKNAGRVDRSSMRGDITFLQFLEQKKFYDALAGKIKTEDIVNSIIGKNCLPFFDNNRNADYTKVVQGTYTWRCLGAIYDTIIENTKLCKYLEEEKQNIENKNLIFYEAPPPEKLSILYEKSPDIFSRFYNTHNDDLQKTCVTEKLLVYILKKTLINSWPYSHMSAVINYQIMCFGSTFLELCEAHTIKDLVF